MEQFNDKVTDGRIPLVLTPNYPSLMTVATRVPSGLYAFALIDLSRLNEN